MAEIDVLALAKECGFDDEYARAWRTELLALGSRILDEAAEKAKSYATCDCGGRHGRCNTNDMPLAIEKAIRALAPRAADPADGG